MTNKKSLLIVVAACAILLLAGVGVFGLLKKSETPQASVVSNNEEPENLGSGTIFDIVKLGKTAKCTYSTDSEGTEMSGISYVSGNNVRGDFKLNTPDGEVIESHMISDGEWVYTWSSAMPQGFKMKSTEAESQESANLDQNQAVSTLNYKFDYRCVPWVKDDSVFNVPADITFTDFNNMMESLDTDKACSACDYMPDEASKAECKSQFNCN